MNQLRTIFAYALYRSRWIIFGWGLPLFLLGVLTVPFYDLVAENERQLRPIIQGLKPFLKSFIGGEAAENLFTPEGFLSLRYFAALPVILGVFGAVAGSGVLATDEERGVLDFLLAQPASRAAIFLGRFLALLVALFLILTLGWIGLWCGVVRADSLSFPPWQLALPYVSAFASTSLFAALAFALSMTMPSRTAAAMTTGFLVLAGYIVTNLANAIPGLEAWARFSPITYFQSDAMGGLHLAPVIGLSLVAGAFTLLAWLGFRRRDIRVAGDGGWKLPFSRKR